jgi:pathogenesis-related protein 1
MTRGTHQRARPLRRGAIRARTHLTAAMVAGCLALGAAPPPVQPLTREDEQAMLTLHNAAKESAKPPAATMRPYTWDPLLASIAQTWASRCVDGGAGFVGHNPIASRRYGASVGENIFATSASSVTPADAVSAWLAERAQYDLAANTCAGRPFSVTNATWTQCGHYVQLVNAGSTKLGCARTRCSRLGLPWTIVCDYAPAGLTVGAGGALPRPYTPRSSKGGVSAPSISPESALRSVTRDPQSAIPAAPSPVARRATSRSLRHPRSRRRRSPRARA